MRGTARAVACCLVLTASVSATAQSTTSATAPADAPPPGPLPEVRFEQRLGEAVPLDASFLDETGKPVQLGDYFNGRPVVLVPVYFECPMLCPLILEGLVKGLKPLKFNPGDEFELVALSFDAEETPEVAATAKSRYIKQYGREDTAPGWHFLTGSEEQIRRVTDAVGFHYAYDAERDEYAHAAGVLILTPEGRLARYFFGIEYPPRDFRLALVEAAEDKIGSLVDQVLLYCYRYDPKTAKYTAVVMNMVRLGALATLVALGLFLTAAWRVERRLTRMESSN